MTEQRTLKDCIDVIKTSLEEQNAQFIQELAKKLDVAGGSITGNLTVQGDTNLNGTARYHNAEIGYRADTLPNRTTNPTTASTDTPEFWRTQSKGLYWYSQTGKLKNQPGQYGWLVHLTGPHTEIQQLFIVAANGIIYSRGANGNGWATGNDTVAWNKATN